MGSPFLRCQLLGSRLEATLAALCLAALLASPAGADSVTLTSTAQGWYNETGYHVQEFSSYLAGHVQLLCSPAPSSVHASFCDYRNFTVFDLSGVSLTITAATLSLHNPDAGPSDNHYGYASVDTTETFTLFDVTTSTGTLTADATGQTTIFADLGSGTSYGSRVVSAADNGTFVEVAINPAGVAALNAASGGPFALGGALTSLTHSSTGPESVFAFTGAYAPTLTLTLVPEPGTALLIAAGLLGVALGRRRAAP